MNHRPVPSLVRGFSGRTTFLESIVPNLTDAIVQSIVDGDTSLTIELVDCMTKVREFLAEWDARDSANREARRVEAAKWGHILVE